MAAVREVSLVALSEYLGNAVRQLSQPQLAPALKFIEIATRSEHLRRFNESKSPDGIPWAPLAHRRVNSKGGDKPLLDTGTLRASIVVRATSEQVVVSSAHVSAGVHQFGATIVPKRAKFLTIPLTKEARYAGSPRRFKRPLSPRINKARTKGVMGEQVGTRFIPHFALVKQVVVPARPFLGFSKELIATIEEALTDVVSRAMDPNPLPTGQNVRPK